MEGVVTLGDRRSRKDPARHTALDFSMKHTYVEDLEIQGWPVGILMPPLAEVISERLDKVFRREIHGPLTDAAIECGDDFKADGLGVEETAIYFLAYESKLEDVLSSLDSDLDSSGVVSFTMNKAYGLCSEWIQEDVSFVGTREAYFQLPIENADIAPSIEDRLGEFGQVERDRIVLVDWCNKLEPLVEEEIRDFLSKSMAKPKPRPRKEGEPRLGARSSISAAEDPFGLIIDSLCDHEWGEVRNSWIVAVNKAALGRKCLHCGKGEVFDEKWLSLAEYIVKQRKKWWKLW